MNISKFCPVRCFVNGVVYVAVSQVGLEMQVSYSHITLLPLQNYNISGYLMIVFILPITCNISLSVILSTGTSWYLSKHPAFTGYQAVTEPRRAAATLQPGIALISVLG